MRKLRDSIPWDEREAALRCGLSAFHSRRGNSALARSGVSGNRLAAIPSVGHAQDHLEAPNAPSYALTNQQAISITIEAIARFDGVVVGRQDMLPAGESADQREQRRARQMKVCEQTFHDTKSKSGNNKKLRIRFTCEHKIR